MELKCLARPQVTINIVEIGSLNVNDVFAIDGMEYVVKEFFKRTNCMESSCRAVPLKMQPDIHSCVKFMPLDSLVVVSHPVTKYLKDTASGDYFFHDGDLLRLDNHSTYDPSRHNCTFITDYGNTEYIIYDECNKIQVTLAEIVLQC